MLNITISKWTQFKQSYLYYSVKINEDHRKYLRFLWKDIVYEYTSLPNGLASAPRLFTKLLKPAFAVLRTMGFLSVVYIDDSYLQAETYDECTQNVCQTIKMVQNLGFKVNFEKSALIPRKQLLFLGFVIDSEIMEIKLPKVKADSLVCICKKLKFSPVSTINDLASAIGVIISTFPAVEFGPLHYRKLERLKIEKLKQNHGNFMTKICLTRTVKKQLQWWIDNIHTQSRKIDHGNAQIVLTSDASSHGWGAHSRGVTTAGKWTLVEHEYHSNILELLAVLYGLRALLGDVTGQHIHVRSDNTTAIAYITKMGGIKSVLCDSVAQDIWKWAQIKNCWITASHIPGSQNVVADSLSRKFDEEKEWKLDKSVFKNIIAVWPKPTIDLFASRTNKQLDKYVSWKPDPYALYVDAFTMCWTNYYSYLFPPFSQISCCLQKVIQDQAEVLMLVPIWPTQAWFPQLMKLLIDYPRILPQHKSLLSLQNSQRVHPLYRTLTLMACRLSGKHSSSKIFRRELPISYYNYGEIQQKSNTQHIFKNGFATVMNGKLIQFIFL
jgi:ribonuclease HI